MKPENEKLVLEALKYGINEVVIREGKAQRLLPEFSKKEVLPLKIVGKGGTCKEFLEYRKDLYIPEKCNAQVNLNTGKITLTLNECQDYDKHFDTIVSQYDISPEITGLNLNTGFNYLPKDLHKKLRMYSRFAANKAEFKDLLKKLTNFNAKVSTEINQIDNRRGISNNGIAKEVKHDLPESFILNIPIIASNKAICVNIEFDSQSEMFQLLSDDFAEIFNAELESAMNEEIAAIREFCLVVFI